MYIVTYLTEIILNSNNNQILSSSRRYITTAHAWNGIGCRSLKLSLLSDPLRHKSSLRNCRPKCTVNRIQYGSRAARIWWKIAYSTHNGKWHGYRKLFKVGSSLKTTKRWFWNLDHGRWHSAQFEYLKDHTDSMANVQVRVKVVPGDFLMLSE